MRGHDVAGEGLSDGAGALGGMAPLGTGGAAGLEHEIGGRRLRGEDGARVQDDKAAIEQFPELDATAGVGALVGAGRSWIQRGPIGLLGSMATCNF